MNVQHIKLNIIPGGVLPVVHVSQYDKNAGGLVFDIYNGGEVYELPSGTTASIEGTKPDGYGFLYPAAAVSGSSVTINVVEQMTVAAGKVICELRLQHQEDNVGTINFILAVEPAGLSDDTEVSETDIPLLREAIEAGQQAIQSAAQAEISADRAEEEADRAEQAAEDLISIKTTAAAAIVTVDDAKAAPLLQLTANIEPTQSGTGDPSPDNVRAISGYTDVTVTRTGRDVLELQDKIINGNGLVGGVTDKVLTLKGTVTSKFDKYINTTPVKDGTYILNGCAKFKNNAEGYWYIYDTNTAKTLLTGANPNGSTVVIPKTANARIGLIIYPNVSVDIECMPVLTEVASTYPITFPSAAGTVYGGTLTVNSDGSGALTVDRTAVDLGTLNWSVVTGSNYATFSSLTALSDAAYSASTPNILCSIYKPDANNTVSPTGDNYIWLNPQKVIRIKDTSKVGMTADEFKTAVTGQTLVYLLATPTTYALSAVQVVQMLQGVNNIWTDANGTTQITYTTQSALSDIQQDIVDLQADVTDLQTEIASAVKKSEITQSGTVTTAGQYVVDAQQLNPTISGTIAKRITDLETAAADDLNTGDITRATNVTATGTKVVDAYELNPSKTGTLAKKIADAASAASAAQSDATAAGTAAGNANTALGGFKFGFTADDKPGYILPGADTVNPFSTGGVEVIAEVANVTAGTSTPVTLATGVDLSEYQFIGLIGVTNTNQHGDCVFTLNVGNSLQVSRQIGWYMENDMSDPRVAGNRYSMFFSVSSSETNATITIQAVNKIASYQLLAQSITLYGIK